MAKKISDTQRIINFAMEADEGALSTVIESLIAIRTNRYPKAKATRKARSDKGTTRQSELPGTEAAK